ncbi:polysaccharide biosynthesis/export family protein [Pokkaliibacter sp. CJK22405]|uniref:polysaccharide biosynthesis/export family protein n=1 Tax=Pokkaliibacter sp. CJK22405 TaxID=3384615 RepID=UPI003984660B
MTKIRFAALCLPVVLLTGCAFSPGMNMDSDGIFSQAELKSDPNIASKKVELIPITSRLVASQNAILDSANTQTIPDSLLTYRPDSYKIGVNDVLRITLWGHPELETTENSIGTSTDTTAAGRLVRHDGTIFFPYAGVIKVSGKSLETVRKEITQRLSVVLDNPQVDVNVLKYASQQVVAAGALTQAGRIPITSQPLTLLEAISKAGGPLSDADYSEIKLIRDHKTYRFDLNEIDPKLHQIYLKDGDSLFVPNNNEKQIYVVGEVQKPQAFKITRRYVSLTEALGTALGLSPTSANGEAVYVIRGSDFADQSMGTVYQLDAQSPTAYALADNFRVLPQDVIFVGPANITRWNRFISQVFPSLNLLNSTRSTVGL